MALALLDFTSGNVDYGVTLAGGSSTSSLKCVLSDLSFVLSREMQSRKTLCSGPWRQRSPQDKGAVITATKQASKGSAISDPLIGMSTDDPQNFTFTAETSNTITGQCLETTEGLGGVAGGSAFAGGASWETYGAVSSTWVTS